MSDFVLILDGVEVDLKGGEEIAATYAASSFQDISTRDSARTESFDLPLTGKNKALVGNAHVVTNDSAIPYKRLTAEGYVGGVLVLDGFAKVNYIAEFINITVFGGNATFYNILKGKRLQDIDLLRFEHRWTFSEVHTSRINTTGYIYPIIDYSADGAYMSGSNRDIDVRTQFAAAFEHTAFEQIVTDAGYLLDAPIASETEFQNVIIPHAREKYIRDRNLKSRINCKVSYSLSEAVGSLDQINLDTVIAGNESSFQCFNSLNGNFLFLDKARCKFIITVSLTNNAVVNNDFYVSVVTGSTGVGGQSNTVILSPGETRSETFEVLAVTPDYYDGVGFNDTTVYMEASQPGMILNAGATCEVELVEDLSDDNSLKIVYSVTGSGDWRNLVTPASIYPDTDQSGFMKEVAQRYGLIYQVNEQTKTVEVRKFSDIVANIPNAKNMTGRIDRTNRTSISFELGEYGRKSYFRYKNDDSVLKPEGTDYGFVIENENLPPEVDVIESIYAATEMVRRLQGFDVPIIKKLVAGVETNKVEPRVLMLDRQDITSGGPIVYKDPTVPVQTSQTLFIPFCYYYVPGKPYNQRYTDLVNRHSSDIITCLKQVKVIKEPVRLNAVDINQLNYFEPWWFDEHGAYFFVSVVDQFKYTTKESTLVELVKLF